MSHDLSSDMVHATCTSYGTSAQQDLQCITTRLFNTKSEQG